MSNPQHKSRNVLYNLQLKFRLLKLYDRGGGTGSMNEDEPPSMDASSGDLEDCIPRDGGPLEAAGYVSQAVGELSQLARAHRLGMLAYLLDMAKLEADETLRRARRA